jgi:hypothetical protein
MLQYPGKTCLKHSNLLKVKDSQLARTEVQTNCEKDTTTATITPARWQRTVRGCRISTTSFLTATTLIYAIGAGITAAAGTRLALQLILANNFAFYSFQSQNH